MLISRFWRCVAISGLALLANGAFAQSKPREVTVPIDKTITLQVGETRVFQFGDAVNRIGLSSDNVVEATSVQNNAFQFKGLTQGKVLVTARSEDNSEVQRMRIVVGGNQVKVYSRDEPDYFSVYCDEFGCGLGTSSKPQAKAVTVRTPTGGGGFIERNY